MHSFDIPQASAIRDITAGPDGNIWAVLERSGGCVAPCPPPDPTPPFAIVRVNLVNPVPVITSIERRVDPVTNEPVLTIRGLGFVPNTVIRWSGTDRTTIYVSPFELALASSDAALAVRGGTFVARNESPGGGESRPFVFKPATSLRRRAAH